MVLVFTLPPVGSDVWKRLSLWMDQFTTEAERQQRREAN
jgi:hypothetical protein